MTYRFKCRATGDLLMLRPDGDTLLRIIGRDPAAQGILEATALPMAIASIEAAIEQEGPRPGSAAKKADPGGGDAHAVMEVSLRQRAWPLLQLLKAAQAAGTELTWGV